MIADQRFNKRKAPQLDDVKAFTSLTRSACPEDQRVRITFIAYGMDLLKNDEVTPHLRVRMSQSEALSLGTQLVNFGQFDLEEREP